MSKIFTVFLFIISILTSVLPAQNTDTILIRNTGSDVLVDTIMGDTLSNGTRADLNRVYLLMRGERYINKKTISASGYHLRIAGQPAPLSGIDPGPAVIQLAPDSMHIYIDNVFNDRITDLIIDVHGDLTLSNLWVLSCTASGTQLWEPIIEEQDSTNIRIDHCIFEWMTGPAIHIDGKWANVYLTNNMFRNAVYKDEWWAGRVIYYTQPADTLLEINNTVENCGFGLLHTQGVGLNYYFCDHNTVVNCAKFCWMESYYKKAFITNNLLVNCHFAAERMRDRKRNDPELLLYGQTINIDTLRTQGRRLTTAESWKYFGTDALIYVDRKTFSPTDPEELGRVIVYCNNANYLDTAKFYDLYRKYNDTVSYEGGKILAEPVMNSRTQSMWSWHPYMINTANIDGVCPHFKFMPENMPLILTFLKDRYSAKPKNNIIWGYEPDSPDNPLTAGKMTAVYKNSSRGNYPTKEDFAFSNAKLLKAGLSGYPIGDLNWFPKKLKGWSLMSDVSLMNKMVPKDK